MSFVRSRCDGTRWLLAFVVVLCLYRWENDWGSLNYRLNLIDWKYVARYLLINQQNNWLDECLIERICLSRLYVYPMPTVRKRLAHSRTPDQRTLCDRQSNPKGTNIPLSCWYNPPWHAAQPCFNMYLRVTNRTQVCRMNKSASPPPEFIDIRKGFRLQS